MKYTQYGNRSLVDIKDRYKSYIKQILDFFNDIIETFAVKQEDLVRIKDSISDSIIDTSNQEKFNNIWSAIGKLNLQRREFYNMVHMTLFAYFEAFNKDFLLKVYLLKPELLLKSSKALEKGEKDKSLDYRTLIDLTNYEEIIFHIANKQVDNYGRFDIDDLNEEFKKKFKFDIGKDLDVWEDLRENYYRRNVVVHNKGLISELYNDKMGKNERIGSKLRTNPKYIIAMGDNLYKYIDYLHDNITSKLKIK